MRKLPLWVLWAALWSLLAVPPLGLAEDAKPQLAEELAEEEARPTTPEEDAEYYELLKLFADTVDQIERNYVKDISRRELMEAAIDGMLSKLDQYSEYIPPDELERFRRGVEAEFGGIGIQVSQDEQGRIEIISPLVGSPAYRAGLLAGDKIVEIEGESTEGMTIDDAVRKMKGPLGSKVELTVVHSDGTRATVAVQRENIRVYTVLGYERGEKDQWQFYADRENKIGYIRLSAFSRHTAEELKATLEQLQKDGLNGLVLDLRFNPGGLLSSAIEICDLFVKEGRIVSTSGRNVPERVWHAHEEGTFTGFPIVVLVNRYSASASEIVSACLQDHERAIVIGERTWGKGSVQNIVELEAGRSALKLTTAGYKRPNGKNIHRFEGASDEDDWGVRPNEDYEVKLSSVELRKLYEEFRRRDLVGAPAPAEDKEEEEEEAFTDQQLAKGLEYLRSKINGESSPGEDTEPQESQEETVAESTGE